MLELLGDGHNKFRRELVAIFGDKVGEGTQRTLGNLGQVLVWGTGFCFVSACVFYLSMKKFLGQSV